MYKYRHLHLNNQLESGVITNKWYQSRAICHNSWMPFCLPVHCQTAPSVCQWSRMQCMRYSSFICLPVFSARTLLYLTLIPNCTPRPLWQYSWCCKRSSPASSSWPRLSSSHLRPFISQHREPSCRISSGFKARSRDRHVVGILHEEQRGDLRETSCFHYAFEKCSCVLLLSLLGTMSSMLKFQP